MEKIAVRENGLIGTLFREGNPSSAVIVLGGASGGMREASAANLAEHGFAALALAYFAEESLPPTLSQIPLEYFEKAFQRLQAEPDIQHIGIWGGSRGAELALLLGVLFPDQIHAIAAHVPSSVVFGSFDSQGSAAWTYKGKPVFPSAPFTLNQMSSGEFEDSSIIATPSFLNSMQNRAGFDAAAIPVENLRCPLLLISAEDDQMWPSKIFAQQITSRLIKCQSKIYYSHLQYPGVGHAPSKGTAGLHPIMKRWFAYGGNPEDNARAAKDWFKQTVGFFKERLCRAF